MRHVITNDWLTLIIILNFILIILAKQAQPAQFKDLMLVLFRSRYITLGIKKHNIFNTFSILLFVNFCLSIGVFTYLLHSYYFNFYTIKLCFLGYLILLGILFFTLQQLLSITLLPLFKLKPIVANLTFAKLTTLNYFGVLLWGINLGLIYSTLPKLILFILAVLVLILILILVFINTLKKSTKLKGLQKFYFLLYLCTLEISPYIFISYLLGVIYKMC